jgi:hypothetical protein
MDFVDAPFRCQTNLAPSCFGHIQTGAWKIGLFADNPRIEDETSDTFYMDAKGLDDQKYRCFKNKVPVTLYDKSQVDAHVIHWHKSGRWFCVTFDTFWEQFNE